MSIGHEFQFFSLDMGGVFFPKSENIDVYAKSGHAFFLKQKSGGVLPY